MSIHLFVFDSDEITKYPILYEWTRLFHETQNSSAQLADTSADIDPIRTEDDLCSAVSTIRRNEAVCYTASKATTEYFKAHSEEIRNEALSYLSAPNRPPVVIKSQCTVDAMNHAMGAVLNTLQRPTEVEDLKQTMHRFLCFVDNAYRQVSTESTIRAVARMTILQQMRETLVIACAEHNITEAELGLSIITPTAIIMTIYGEIPDTKCEKFLYLSMQFLFYYRNYALFLDM